MATSINITYKDKNYKLEYNRRTAQLINKQGFKLSEIEDDTVTMLPLLFYGAFLMNHKRIELKETDKIYKNLRGKEELIPALIKMYTEPLNALLDEPDDDEEDEGNASWTIG